MGKGVSLVCGICSHWFTSCVVWGRDRGRCRRLLGDIVGFRAACLPASKPFSSLGVGEITRNEHIIVHSAPEELGFVQDLLSNIIIQNLSSVDVAMVWDASDIGQHHWCTHDFLGQQGKFLAQVTGGISNESLDDDRVPALVYLIHLFDLFVDSSLVIILRQVGGWRGIGQGSRWSWHDGGLGRERLDLVDKTLHCAAQSLQLL